MQDKARDDESLVVLELHHRLCAPRHERGHIETEQLHTMREVWFGDFRLYQQLDIVAANDGRNELDRGAELLEDY
jgi:hypothetical protein